MSDQSKPASPGILTGWREAAARIIHELVSDKDPDELIHRPSQKSWEEPTWPRWEQWLETVDQIASLPAPGGWREIESAAACKACGGQRRMRIIAGTCTPEHDIDCPVCVGIPVGPPVIATVWNGWVLAPRDDNSRPFADSQLPEAMIRAGEAVFDQVDADNANYVAGETTDWDTGMIVVAIYRAMLASLPAPGGWLDLTFDTIAEAIRSAKDCATQLRPESPARQWNDGRAKGLDEAAAIICRFAPSVPAEGLPFLKEPQHEEGGGGDEHGPAPGGWREIESAAGLLGEWVALKESLGADSYDGIEPLYVARLDDLASRSRELLAGAPPYDIWGEIGRDPRLAQARRKLSLHEIRLIVCHALGKPLPEPPYSGGGKGE